MSSKTEEATPKRRTRAQEDGDSGSSSFFAQSLAFVCVVTGLSRFGPALRDGFQEDVALALASQDLSATMLASRVLKLAVPLLLVSATVTAIALLVQTGGALATKRLAPNWDQLNPIPGLAKLVSRDRIVAVLRALVLSIAASMLAYRVLRTALPDLRNLTGNAEAAPAFAAALTLKILSPLAWLSLAASVLDLAYQRWSWLTRLRMSKEEVKREHKESEGDPQMKAARERAHHEMVSQAVLGNVKKATVLVVNPTHIACALRYVDGEDNAPVVVGSGEGELAQRMIRVAREHGIPVLRNVPLARALREVELDGEIPEVLFEAVAEILRDIQDGKVDGFT